MVKEYVTSSGKKVPAKGPMKCVSCKCAHICGINFSAEDRSDINQRFQRTKNVQLRRQYIVDRIKSGIRKQVTVHDNSRKKQTCEYFLDKKVNEEHGVDKCERIQVCRIVFYETLQVNEKSFPKTKSHYCRKGTKKIYIENTSNFSKLTVAKMHSLYKEK